MCVNESDSLFLEENALFGLLKESWQFIPWGKCTFWTSAGELTVYSLRKMHFLFSEGELTVYSLRKMHFLDFCRRVDSLFLEEHALFDFWTRVDSLLLERNALFWLLKESWQFIPLRNTLPVRKINCKLWFRGQKQHLGVTSFWPLRCVFLLFYVVNAFQRNKHYWKCFCTRDGSQRKPLGKTQFWSEIWAYLVTQNASRQLEPKNAPRSRFLQLEIGSESAPRQLEPKNAPRGHFYNKKLCIRNRW